MISFLRSQLICWKASLGNWKTYLTCTMVQVKVNVNMSEKKHNLLLQEGHSPSQWLNRTSNQLYKSKFWVSVFTSLSPQLSTHQQFLSLYVSELCVFFLSPLQLYFFGQSQHYSASAFRWWSPLSLFHKQACPHFTLCIHYFSKMVTCLWLHGSSALSCHSRPISGHFPMISALHP